MTIVAVGSVAGSPGATSLVLGLAATWPDTTRTRVVVEADPDGGRLGAELGIGVEPGLMAVALAIRSTALSGPDLVARGAGRVGDWYAIPAPPSSEQATSALVHAATPLATLMAADDDALWLVDAGRLSARSPALPLATAAAHTIVVSAGSFPLLQLLPHRVDALRAAGCVPSVAVVEPTPWPVEEIADFVGADVVVVLPHVTAGRRSGPGAMGAERVAAVVAACRGRRRVPRCVGPQRGRRMSATEVRLEEVIEAVQEALVVAEAGVDPRRWDDLEREAFAHDAATSYVARRARAALEAGATPLPISAEDDLVRRAIAAYFHAGKFQALLDLEGVTDIMVNAHDAIWLQRVDGTLERYREPIFTDAADLRDEVAHLARRAGGTERRFDDAKPLLVLRLPDGSRLAAVMNVSTVPQVAIRRNVLPDASLDDLEQRGTIDRAMHSLLAAAMRAGMRVVVSGETGAGKTTLLRAMTNVLPPETRMVIIEDTRELDLGADPARADSVLEWETREANIEGVGEIAQRELVRHALRFNPAWLIVGEVRDGDAAREMLLAMQHGHPSLSTVHHHSALSAWKKLAQYVAQGSEAVEFPIAALLISDAVDLFVHLGRDRQGRRAVTEICEVAGWNGAEVQLNRLFVAGPDGRGLPQPHLTDARRTTLREHGFEDHLLLNEAGWWAS